MHHFPKSGNWVIHVSVILLSLSTPGLAYKFKSAPGCPKDKENNNDVWLLDEGNNCHKVNSQGPCGENMLFFPHPSRSDKIHGFCDCFDARMETEDEIDYLSNRELSHCMKDIRSQIFVPERNRCYSAFDQGPCSNAGKWLVLNDTHYPVCAKNHCTLPFGSLVELDPLSTRFQFSHSGTDKCYSSMSRGYCPRSYRLRFSPNDWLPKCRYSPSSTQPNKRACPQAEKPYAGGIVLRSRCKPGSRRDYLSKCTQSVNPR